ncbi:hypothetical protein KI387_029586, partial [Taxus chinensis]
GWYIINARDEVGDAKSKRRAHDGIDYVHDDEGDNNKEKNFREDGKHGENDDLQIVGDEEFDVIGVMHGEEVEAVVTREIRGL